MKGALNSARATSTGLCGRHASYRRLNSATVPASSAMLSPLNSGLLVVTSAYMRSSAAHSATMRSMTRKCWPKRVLLAPMGHRRVYLSSAVMRLKERRSHVLSS